MKPWHSHHGGIKHLNPAHALILILLALIVSGRAGATEFTVAIHDDFFSPKTISIAPGDIVTWTNQGNVAHTTTSVSNLWDSGLLNPGDTFSQAFTNLGKFDYFCQVHGLMMSGTVLVTTNGAPHDLFLVNLSGSFKATNSTGAIVLTPSKTKDFVADCAADAMRDPAGLTLVYDLQSDALEVVDIHDSSVVCTKMTFTGGVTLATPDGTHRERQAYVMWEDSSETSGSLAATELSTRTVGGDLLKYSLRGTVQVGLADYEGQPPQIFLGNFSTGKRFVPQP